MVFHVMFIWLKLKPLDACKCVCDRVVHQVTKPVENFICTKPCLCSPQKQRAEVRYF